MNPRSGSEDCLGIGRIALFSVSLSIDDVCAAPAGSTTEVEDYTINLNAVSVLELAIQPDLGGREAVASLAACRLG